MEIQKEKKEINRELSASEPKLPGKTKNAIVKDIERTLLGVPGFDQKKLQVLLENIAESYLDQCAYCQGMNFVGAFFVIYFPSIEFSFKFFSALLETHMKGLYCYDMQLLLGLGFILENSLEELIPDLAHHFNILKIESSMFVTPFLLTVFSKAIRSIDIPPIVLMIWDIFLHVNIQNGTQCSFIRALRGGGAEWLSGSDQSTDCHPEDLQRDPQTHGFR